jgi:redox-sensitive bicupin YhaK (pirin superfamily)
MITVRQPDEIYRAKGRIQNGTFSARWHFSFDQYYDSEYKQFGTLRVFNDDTLSPGAVWPLQPHRGNEVVTYCVEGKFRHADERGAGGILKKGWVQHTTVGMGMWHSEINNLSDKPMRFVQMWFIPSVPDLEPAVQQKRVTRRERMNRFLILVSNKHREALPLFSNAEVYSCFLHRDRQVRYELQPKRGAYLYVLEGGSLQVNDLEVPLLGAAKVLQESEITIKSETDTELLMIDVGLS